MDDGRRYWNLITVCGYGVVWCNRRDFIKRLSFKLDCAGVIHLCSLDIHIDIHPEDNPNWTYYKPSGSSFGCFVCFKRLPAKTRDKIIVRLCSTFKEFYGKS